MARRGTEEQQFGESLDGALLLLGRHLDEDRSRSTTGRVLGPLPVGRFSLVSIPMEKWRSREPGGFVDIRMLAR
jgi:hypothetical protein